MESHLTLRNITITTHSRESRINFQDSMGPDSMGLVRKATDQTFPNTHCNYTRLAFRNRFSSLNVRPTLLLFCSLPR